MTPYVVNENDNDRPVVQKPKSIMVGPAANGNVHGSGTANGAHVNGSAAATSSAAVNGGVVKIPIEDFAETPDSLPSRSSVSGRSIIGNGKNGKSGALKRVSFGSSKGSMVETLVYDHLEDLGDLPPPFLTAEPVTNGEESRVHPAKVRVKFFESQQVTQVTCPSPDVTLPDFGSDTMTSPTSAEQSPDYHRQISHDSGMDNPFRPDGELSREADTIVSLIKEGKPITPIKGDNDLDDLDNNVMVNGYPVDQSDSQEVKEGFIMAKSTSPLESSKSKVGANGSTPKDQKPSAPGVVEVQRGIVVPPKDAPQVEQVVIKKKPKCKCCVVQ